MSLDAGYLFFNGIPRFLRMALSFILLLTAYLLQLSTRNVLTGLPFVIFCMIFNLIRNVSIKPVQALELKWQEVTESAIQQVNDQCRKIKKFQSANLGCVIGFLVFFVWFCIMFMPVLQLPLRFSALIIDGIVLLSGLLLSGRRTAWQPAGLDTKIPIIQRILSSPQARDPDLQFLPYLEIGKTKTGSFPNDTRILIRFRQAPETFIGVQIQISINNVKNTAYPYLYAVVAAKPAFKLYDRFQDPKLKNVVVEKEDTGEVDVLVIRQITTRTSGYHTSTETQDYIIAGVILAAKQMLVKN